MLYAAGVPDGQAMRNAPHVGISTVWWEGNPCKLASPFLVVVVSDMTLPGSDMRYQHTL